MARITVVSIAAALGVAALTSGCATVSQGTKQTVAVSTPGVPAATCHLADGKSLDSVVTTPATIILHKRHAPITVTCTASGQSPVTRVFHPKYAKSARIQLPGGYAADALSGAMWAYPAEFVVSFAQPEVGAARMAPPR